MLHTKIREHRPAGSGEDFTIYGRGDHLSHVTWTIYTNFRSAFPRRLYIKFGFDWPSGFRPLKMVDGRRRTDGRRLDGYTISSPCEPNGPGELKIPCSRY